MTSENCCRRLLFPALAARAWHATAHKQRQLDHPNARVCVMHNPRAVAIALGMDYDDVYSQLSALGWRVCEPGQDPVYISNEKFWREHSDWYDPETVTLVSAEEFQQPTYLCYWRNEDGSRLRIGESRRRLKRWFGSFGWEWTEVSGVRLRADELPAGRLIVSIPEHWVAVIDNVAHDTWNPFESGTAWVEGYWSVP